MRVVANGKSLDLPDGCTVAGLIDRLGLKVRSVAVERNGEAVVRSSYATTRLDEGDRLEVVRPVQGGAGTEARRALADARLYLVAPAGFASDRLESVIRAGAGIVQLREKDGTDLHVLAEGRRFADVAAASDCPFVVNDRADLCAALGADGVHLGQDDLPPADARRMLGPGPIIGRSTHSADEVAAAVAEHEAGDVDYIAVGPIEPTPTKPGRPGTGYDLIRYAADHVPCPWFAIGGISADTVDAAVAAGARRVVVVRAIVEATDPAEATRTILGRLPELERAR